VKIYLILLGLIVAGCQNGMLMTRGDIREAEQSKRMQDSVSSTQKAVADNNSRFSDIEADLRSLHGRVEVAEARTQQLINDRGQMKQGIESTNSDQTKRILILQEGVGKLQDQMAQVMAELAALRSASPPEVAEKTSPKDSFQVAEDSFDKKDWKKAILNYNRFRDANPKSKKFAEATYKIGVCFQELGMKDEAKTFYDEVIGKYPNSSDAKKARTRLKSLKR
jgi:TolA-binding protein